MEPSPFQERLFDDKPYIVHHYFFPRVVEVVLVPDPFINGLPVNVFELPKRQEPPDLVA